MPYIHVPMSNGSTWGITNCEIVIPVSGLKGYEVEEIGVLVLSLIADVNLVRDAQHDKGFEQVHTLAELHRFTEKG